MSASPKPGDLFLNNGGQRRKFAVNGLPHRMMSYITARRGRLSESIERRFLRRGTHVGLKGPSGRDLDHDIDIAIWPGVAARAGAEKGGMRNALRLESGFVSLERRDDVLSVHARTLAWLL